ncbi:MAG: hypothetical protein WCP20_04645 [Desulfuromonadales bacterium]
MKRIIEVSLDRNHQTDTDVMNSTEADITETDADLDEAIESVSDAVTSLDPSASPTSPVPASPQPKLVTERKEVGQVWVMQSKANKGAPGESIEGHSVLGVLLENVSYLGFRITGDLSDEAADYRLFCADENGILQEKGLVWKITSKVDKKNEQPVTTLYIRINSHIKDTEISESDADEVNSGDADVTATDAGVDGSDVTKSGADYTNAAEGSKNAEGNDVKFAKTRVDVGTDADTVNSGDSDVTVTDAGAGGNEVTESGSGFTDDADGSEDAENDDIEFTGTDTDADAMKSGETEVTASDAGMLIPVAYYIATQKKAVVRATPGKGMMNSKVPAFGIYRRVFALPNELAEGDTGADADAENIQSDEVNANGASGAVKSMSRIPGPLPPRIPRVLVEEDDEVESDDMEGFGTVESGKQKAETFGVDDDNESLNRITSKFKWPSDNN